MIAQPIRPPKEQRAAEPTAGSRQHRRFAEILAVALFCVTLLLYAPARNHDFISYDDHAYTDPAFVQQGLTWPGVRWAFTTGYAANWHPLTWLSHMTDVEIFGPGPAGPHFVNAILHAANALLAFFVFSALTRNAWPSLVVAALFALHPLRVESVAWVAERKDLLSALFFLLTLLAYERYARSGGAVTYTFVILAFALGLLAKPMVVTLPCILLLLDLWPLNRVHSWRRLIVEKIPFFLLALALCVVTYRVQHQAGAMIANQYPAGLRIENAFYACGRYLWKTIWPAKLAVFYPYMGALPGTSIPLPGVAASAVVLLLITAIGLWRWRHNRAILIGWLWFLGMLVPVIGLVQVGMQSMADRYSYLPHLGLLVALVFGGAEIVRRFQLSPRNVGLLVGGALMALAYQTSAQLTAWQDTITVFNHALAVTTHNHVAHSNLAYTYMQDAGRQQEAVEHLRKSLAINPASHEAYYNMGLVLERSGNYPTAQSWYEQSLQRDPSYVPAQISLANVLLAQGQGEQAIEHYRQAIVLEPESFLAHYNLGLALFKRSGDAAALGEFEQAVRLSPRHAEARYSYAMSLRAASREREAAVQFGIAAQLAQEQRLDDLLAEVQKQQKQGGALPKPTTNAENQRP